MHPAASIILFTTLSGAGYGLLAVAAFGLAAGLIAPRPVAGFVVMGSGLVLVTAGLAASTLHLKHPERAWRAFGQWRSSWLSREAVASAATFPPALLLAFGWAVRGEVWRLPALLTVLGATATVLCTGQIYACLKPIARWHHPLTTPCYLALGAGCGAVVGVAALRLAGSPSAAIEVAASLLLGLAWASKAFWWQRTDRATSAATPESAIGLPHYRAVRLSEPPHTGGNYVSNEMGFRIARKHGAKLRRIAVLLGAVVPAACLAALLAAPLPGAALTALSCLGSVAALLGTGVERWLFFAEARHTATLYYGAIRA